MIDYSQYPPTKKEAKEQGLSWYYTGKPCKRGHFSVRHVSNGNCYACLNFKPEEPLVEFDVPPSSWSEAVDKGAKYFHTGKLCKNGHDSTRFTYNGNCRQCMLDKAAEWRAENQEYNRQRVKEWDENNKEWVKERERQRREGPQREQILQRTREFSRQYYIENREYRIAQVNERRARKLNATPAWSEETAIRDLYASRQEGEVVDHIIPLKNENVCGLHCLDNLQVIPHEENAKKRNKLLPDYTEHKGRPPKFHER